MGACIVIILWGEFTAVVGGLYNSFSRAYYAQGLFNIIYEWIFGFIWGGFAGLVIGEFFFFALLFLYIGYFSLKERYFKGQEKKPQVKVEEISPEGEIKGDEGIKGG